MLDLLLAAVTFPLIIALGLALLAVVTLVPFVVALQMAERRGFSTTRWGAVSIAASLVGVALTLLVVRSETTPDAFALLPLLLTWVAPGALWLLSGEEELIGGRAGAHEP